MPTSAALTDAPARDLKTRTLNFIGGLPDLAFTSLPDPTIPINPLARDRYLQRLTALDPARWPQDQRPFLVLPDDAPELSLIGSAPYRAGVREIFTYPSRYQTRNPELGPELDRYPANRTGYLNLWRHDPAAPRPLVLLLHGFMMGHPQRAEQVFKIPRLFDDGIDVALYTLPHHWRRQRGRQRLLNPDDVPLTLESFGQNLHDLHSAVLALQGRGHRRIGLIGASMGGLTAALYAATVAAELEFMFLAVPAVRLDHYLEPKDRYFSFPVDAELRAKTRAALDLIDPARLEPCFDLDRLQVVMHGGDRLCPVAETRRWISAWGVRHVVEVAGGHWLYLDRKARGRAFGAWLERFVFLG